MHASQSETLHRKRGLEMDVGPSSATLIVCREVFRDRPSRLVDRLATRTRRAGFRRAGDAGARANTATLSRVARIRAAVHEARRSHRRHLLASHTRALRRPARHPTLRSSSWRHQHSVFGRAARDRIGRFTRSQRVRSRSAGAPRRHMGAGRLGPRERRARRAAARRERSPQRLGADALVGARRRGVASEHGELGSSRQPIAASAACRCDLGSARLASGRARARALAGCARRNPSAPRRAPEHTRSATVPTGGTGRSTLGLIESARRSCVRVGVPRMHQKRGVVEREA